VDPLKHVAIRYALYAFGANGEPVQLPHPEGLSGSVLWDTKYVATGENDWGPVDARTAALIFGYYEDHANLFGQGAANRTLLAVKIEYVREFLLDALRHEAAYYRSLERGTAPEDALSDWLWAEQQITGID
jgi:hypothetical protein